MQPPLLNSRAVVLVLLLANLGFLAWAILIDRKPEPALTSATSPLPKLVLASEARAAARNRPQPSAPISASPAPAPPDGAATGTQSSAAPSPGAAPASGSVPTGANGAASASVAMPGAGGAPAPTAATPAVAPAASATLAQSAPPVAATDAPHCVTVGPFNDQVRAARGAELLRTRGFSPRQHAEAGDSRSGYWVYVGHIASESQQSDIVRRLGRAGIDAQALPASDGQRRVSAGMFNERPGAESRAKAVRSLGLSAEVAERKQTANAYWVDVDLATSNQTLPMDGLLSLEESGARLQIRACPGGASATPDAGAKPVTQMTQAQSAR